MKYPAIEEMYAEHRRAGGTLTLEQFTERARKRVEAGREQRRAARAIRAAAPLVERCQVCGGELFEPGWCDTADDPCICDDPDEWD